jgi:F-actin capping protein, beta subunit
MLASRYFEGGVSSVYLWDLDDGFAGVVLLKKGEIIDWWRKEGHRMSDFECM